RSLFFAGFWSFHEPWRSPVRSLWWPPVALIAILLAASCVQVADGRTDARRVIETEAEAVRGLSAGLDEGFDRAVEAMKATAATSCRVVVTGIGKSGIVGQKIAATLASTGTASFFLHPSEASVA